MFVRADIRQDLPAALAFFAIGLFEDDTHARHFWQAEGLVRHWIAGQADRRGDADIGEGHRPQGLEHLGILDMDNGCRLERGADDLGRALHFQGRRHHAADAADFLPFLRKRFIQPVAGRLGHILQMDR